MPRLARLFLLAALGLAVPLDAGQNASLRLIPFPKECRLDAGALPLGGPLTLEAPATNQNILARLLNQELQRAGLPAAEVRTLEGSTAAFRLVTTAGEPGLLELPPGDSDERYVLTVTPEGVVCAAAPGGLLHGMQTLCQLIRANRSDGGIPCLTIRDWPSLRWRCFQDDMTRGPSSRLDTLKFEASLGSFLKLNLMTYYMEYQFAFQKHPQIGPPDGSLTPEELAALVTFAKPLGVDILGNQQSFGHFSRILALPEYAHLKEGNDVLNPLHEGSYRLLDDMYSEQCPLLPFPFFNVCCDETWELGKGPTKELAEEIGVGGVYVRHIRRVHEILAKKYGKRMMMWGDIILQHPDRLAEIPRDTIMLTWGYDARDNFEKQIVPFKESGYEFFVCPGVSNWSRILPDFNVATTNIAHFVRDGAKHGALGMINTDWEDDGEAINAVKWYCDAWAAECAWNASATPLDDFNRRVGGVLFGEVGDRFGQAVGRLAEAHRMPGMGGMNNRRFWEDDFAPRSDPHLIESRARRLLEAVSPARESLEALKGEATVNQRVIDAYVFGARRMERIALRMLDGLEAARLYQQACAEAPGEAVATIEQVQTLVRRNRDAHETLGREFSALWLAESEPYALQWTMERYARTVASYDALLERLANARKAAEADKPLPAGDEIGLAMPEAIPRRARPQKTNGTPLTPEAQWAEPSATHRIGLVVEAGSADRHELPIEVELPLPAEFTNKPVRAFAAVAAGEPCEILAQLDPSTSAGKSRLTALLPGPLASGQQALVHIYLGMSGPATSLLPQAVSTREAADDMHWIENDRLRLLLGPAGSHLYRCEIKSLENRDLTEPGDTDWAGFADIHALRRVPYRLTALATGPALVRFQCLDEQGHGKMISVYGGTSWIEVMLNEPTPVFWNFDSVQNFAAEASTPGEYLFSTGARGAVGRAADGVSAQVASNGADYGIKFNRDKLALGLATPGRPARHLVAPGSGAGGVGIENSPPASHFVIFAGLLETEPAETMERLIRTLDLNKPPAIVLHTLQANPGTR